MFDARTPTGRNAMTTAEAYEAHRGAVVTDVSDHDARAVQAALDEVRGGPCWGLSCDLLSRGPDGLRIIEVKGRSTGGPVQGLPERALNTLQAAGRHGWLYVVFGALRPDWPLELRTIPSAGDLPWVLEGHPQPVGALGDINREARYRLDSDVIREAADPVDLSSIRGLPDRTGYRGPSSR